MFRGVYFKFIVFINNETEFLQGSHMVKTSFTGSSQGRAKTFEPKHGLFAGHEEKNFARVFSDYLNELQTQGISVAAAETSTGEYGVRSDLTLRTAEGKQADIHIDLRSTHSYGEYGAVPFTGLNVVRRAADPAERLLMDMTSTGEEAFTQRFDESLRFQSGMVKAMITPTLAAVREMTENDMKPAADVLRSLSATIVADNLSRVPLEGGKEWEKSFPRPTGEIKHGPLAGKMTWEQAGHVLADYGKVAASHYGGAYLTKKVDLQYVLGSDTFYEHTIKQREKSELGKQWEGAANGNLVSKMPAIIQRLFKPAGNAVGGP